MIFDWRLLKSIKCDDYIIWSYPNFKLNGSFKSFCLELELNERDNAVPKCIIKIVEIINQVTYFNKEIRVLSKVLTWHNHIFTYYSRYYRYQQNEKLHGKKKFLNYRHGQKLHFVSCIKNRELTGVRLCKNHLVF